jgi:C-terminal processing protease CtpA/Prc
LDDRGIVPDILVETTIEDQIAGTDPVLDYTLEMIERQLNS